MTTYPTHPPREAANNRPTHHPTIKKGRDVGRDGRLGRLGRLPSKVGEWDNVNRDDVRLPQEQLKQTGRSGRD